MDTFHIGTLMDLYVFFFFQFFISSKYFSFISLFTSLYAVYNSKKIKHKTVDDKGDAMMQGIKI